MGRSARQNWLRNSPVTDSRDEGSVIVRDMLINRPNVNNVKDFFAVVLNIDMNILPVTLGFYYLFQKYC